MKSTKIKVTYTIIKNGDWTDVIGKATGYVLSTYIPKKKRNRGENDDKL